MRLARKRQTVEGDADDIVRGQSADCPKAVHSLHEYAHEEKTAKTSRQDAEETLKLVVNVADIRVREPQGHKSARKPHDYS